jgi:preprotein translocase subunit SecG
MMDDILMPLLAIACLLLVCYILYQLARSLRRGGGGGSATNFMIGTTDLLRNTDQNRAAEVIIQ